MLLHLHCCVRLCGGLLETCCCICIAVCWALTEVSLHLHRCVVGCYRGVAAFALLCGGLLETCCCICIAVWWAVRDMLLHLHCCVVGY